MEWFRSALGSVIAFLPDLVAGLLILVVGYILARVLARLARAVVPRTGLDRLANRYKLGASERAGTEAVAKTAFWVVMLIAVMQAARAWNLRLVATGIAAVLAYIPNLLAAAVIVGLAVLAGGWVRGRIRARAGAGASFQAELARGLLIGLGLFLGLRQLQIAPEIVTLAFALTLGALAVAGALAFGLGARAVAGDIARDWYATRRPRAQGGRTTSPSRPRDGEERLPPEAGL